jgi:hypothetical protein
MCETAGEGPINMCGFTGKPRPSSGGFLKWGYPSIINFRLGFSIVKHPAIGVPPFMESPI